MQNLASYIDLSADILTNAVESGHTESWANLHRFSRREEDGLIVEVELSLRGDVSAGIINPRHVCVDRIKIVDAMSQISAGETRIAEPIRTRIRKALESGDYSVGDLDPETDDCILQFAATGKLAY